MSIFSGLFRSRDKPTDSTTGSTYRFLFGGTTSGKAVTERSAMQMTAVYSCVRILSEAIAGLPIHLYRSDDDGSNFNQSFLSAFWTIKGIILQNSVLPNFITGFAPTNRTQYPFAFHHN